MSDRLLKESDVLRAIDKRIEELSQDLVFIRKNGIIDIMGVKKYILTIPSVDRPQGKWIETTYTVWDGTDEEHEAIYRNVPTVKCSNCGKQSLFHRRWIVCPYCDAKMEGADDESLRANWF